VFLDRAHGPILADAPGGVRWRPDGGSARVEVVAGVVVLGQVGRDLVLQVRALPDAGGAVSACDRWELLGGKGANQAVALVQCGVSAALVGVVGDDAPGDEVLAEAAADGIDVAAVRRRPGAQTALLVDLVEDGGRRRLVESVPSDALLTPEDVEAAAGLLRSCASTVLQLQQPGPAVRTALRLIPDDVLVVADGAPADEETRTAVLSRADVVRADRAEAAELVGRPLGDLAAVRAAAAELLTAGPRLVCLAAGDDGNLTAWRAGPPPGRAATGSEQDRAEGEVLVPLIGGPVVDPTGAGDATVAALTAALLGGAAPEDAAWTAAAAAALTVTHPGGRPRLSAGMIADVLREHLR
jgi:ribokinase